MTGELQKEIKQFSPFRSLEAEVYLNVLRTSATLAEEFVELLRPHGLTQAKYNVLRILRGAGPEGLPSGEIGERMVTREPDMTRLLDGMEAKGLLVRERSTTDRRVVTARLTEHGKQLADELDQQVDSLHQQQLGHMTEDELRALCDLLVRARQSGNGTHTSTEGA